MTTYIEPKCNLVLERTFLGKDYTIGRLYLNSLANVYRKNRIRYLCDTLEPAVREKKIKGKTAIPSGIYKGIINTSQRFGCDLPLLLNVPNFEEVRIHTGVIAYDHTCFYAPHVCSRISKLESIYYPTNNIDIFDGCIFASENILACDNSIDDTLRKGETMLSIIKSLLKENFTIIITEEK